MRSHHILIPAIVLLATLGTPKATLAQDCDPKELRETLTEMIRGEAPQEEIDAKVASCSDNEPLTNSRDGLLSNEAEAQNTTPTGSIFWEQIDACGYHPQRRELDCAVEVRQRFGFAGTPPGAPGFNGPGSWEWIQFCVDFGAGLVPINLSAVHVHDEAYGVNPSWYYGVSVQANPALHTALVNGQTLKARAILSWTVVPTGCNFNPIWGNQADFKIKLDP